MLPRTVWALMVTVVSSMEPPSSPFPFYGELMLKTRTKRLAIRSASAAQHLADIQATIIDLADEDLLDLADIFQSKLKGPIAEMAAARNGKRNISL